MGGDSPWYTRPWGVSSAWSLTFVTAPLEKTEQGASARRRSREAERIRMSADETTIISEVRLDDAFDHPGLADHLKGRPVVLTEALEKDSISCRCRDPPAQRT
jgi:hypothetical protein